MHVAENYLISALVTVSAVCLQHALIHSSMSKARCWMELVSRINEKVNSKRINP